MIFFCVSGRNGVSSARELKRSGLHIPPPSRPKLQFGGIGVRVGEEEEHVGGGGGALIPPPVPLQAGGTKVCGIY
jgi:hypothetical protein